MIEKNRWSDYDRQRLLDWKAKGDNFPTIGKRLGRTRDAVAEQWRWLTKGPEWQQNRRDKTAAYRRKWGERARRKAYEADPLGLPPVNPSGRPSAELLAAAWARSTAPQTLTGAFFGDPPIGYSALDRREARHGI